MTQEEKQLLLVDLCARLPYGVKTLTPWEKDGPGLVTLIDITSSRQVRVFEDWYKIKEVKPYLRPMSSMIEEEIGKYKCLNDALDENYEVHIDNAYPAFDWLNAHHFDFRNLIGLGLALEAPADMYNSKKK